MANIDMGVLTCEGFWKETGRGEGREKKQKEKADVGLVATETAL